MITAMEDRIKARQDVVELETILAELNTLQDAIRGAAMRYLEATK